jgi:hypothetical protein
MYSTKHHPDSSAELRNTGGQGIEIAQAMIIEAQNAGELAPGDPETLAMVCFVSLHGAALLAAGKHLEGTTVDAMVSATTDTLWAGMAAGVPAAKITQASQAGQRNQPSATALRWIYGVRPAMASRTAELSWKLRQPTPPGSACCGT